MDTGVGSDAARIEDLLQEDRWLRGLVLQLVDPDAVDDILQQTWMQALRRPPHRLGRGWLATVARNFARRRHREDARRAHHEAAAAQQESLPSTEDTVERLAAQRQVTESVGQLAEPYRTAVLLRFYHGLSYPEIAERTAVREANARQRVARGLAALRERMADTWGEEWRRQRAIGLLLTPLTAGLPATAPVASTLSTLGAGALIVNKYAKIAIATVLLLGGGTLVYLESQPQQLPEPPLPERSVAADSPATVAPTDTAADGERAPSPARTSIASAAWNLEGTVVDLQARPVGGVVLTHAKTRQEPQGQTVGEPEELAISETSGSVRVATDPLVGDAIDAVAPWRMVMHTFFRSPEAPSECQFVVGREVEFGGLVVDQDQRPVPEATIRARNIAAKLFPRSTSNLTEVDRTREVKSDLGGSFALPVVAGCTQITVHKPGYRIARYLVPESGGLNPKLVLRALDGEELELHGSLLGPRNEPIAGGLIALDTFRTETDAYGQFALAVSTATLSENEPLVAAKTGWQTFVDPGFGGRVEEAAGQDLELRLVGRSLEIRGRLLDAEGAPLTQVAIYPAGTPRVVMEATAEDLALPESFEPHSVAGNPIRAHGITDGDGRFTIPGLRQQSYRLRVLDVDRSLSWMSPPLQPSEQEVELRIPATAFRTISGTLHNTNGEPVAGADLRLWLDGIDRGSGRISIGGEAVGTTDEEGRFAVPDVPRIGGALSFLHEDYDALNLRLEADAESEGLELTAYRTGLFRLEVLTQVDKIRSAQAVDDRGMPVQVSQIVQNGSSGWMRVPLEGGRTPVLTVSERAQELVLLDRDLEEVARVPLRIDPDGDVTLVRY